MILKLLPGLIAPIILPDVVVDPLPMIKKIGTPGSLFLI